MRIYYLPTGKILKVYSEFVDRLMPEDSPKTAINTPYSVLEIDERYNRLLTFLLLRNDRTRAELRLPDRFSVNASGQLVNNDTGQIVPINANPSEESYRLSFLFNKTQADIDTWIDGITDLASAKDRLKKLAAVVLYLVKQTGLDE